MTLENMPGPFTIGFGFAGLYVVYQLALVIYNIYFHPLRKFPGPIHRAGLHFGDYYHLLVGSHPQNLKELHDEYGDVVRIRPDMLTFRNAEAWKDIYGSRPGKGQLPKDPRFYDVGSGNNHIIFCNDADHTRQRKLLSHAFSDAALRQQEPIMNPYFELLVSQLKKRVDGPEDGVVDLTAWYNYLTFDIIGDMCFNESFGALAGGVSHKWMSNLLGGAKYGRFLVIAQFYEPLLTILRGVMGIVPAVGRAQKEHDEFTKLKTRTRLASKVERPDFMSYILRHNDERGMTNKEIEGTSGLLIIAGSETTATTLSGLTYFLLKNPDMHAKAQAEIRSTFETAESINLTSTGHLPYLDTCIKETFRMYPAVPLALPRITPKEGAMINDKFIPGSTRVAVPQWASYQSETNFFEHKKFDPARWLANPPEQYKNDNLDILQPFSTGPRNCIGKNLAYNEMRSVMARMMFHFDMELVDKAEKWEVQECYFFWEKSPLKVKLTHRQF